MLDRRPRNACLVVDHIIYTRSTTQYLLRDLRTNIRPNMFTLVYDPICITCSMTLHVLYDLRLNMYNYMVYDLTCITL
jgi:hypothetical protein